MIESAAILREITNLALKEEERDSKTTFLIQFLLAAYRIVREMESKR